MHHTTTKCKRISAICVDHAHCRHGSLIHDETLPIESLPSERNYGPGKYVIACSSLKFDSTAGQFRSLSKFPLQPLHHPQNVLRPPQHLRICVAKLFLALAFFSSASFNGIEHSSDVFQQMTYLKSFVVVSTSLLLCFAIALAAGQQQQQPGDQQGWVAKLVGGGGTCDLASLALKFASIKMFPISFPQKL